MHARLGRDAQYWYGVVHTSMPLLVTVLAYCELPCCLPCHLRRRLLHALSRWVACSLTAYYSIAYPYYIIRTDARQDVHRIYDCRQPRIDHTPSRSLYRIIHPILISTLSSTTSVPSASGSSVSPHAAASTTEASGQRDSAEQDHSAHPSTLLPSAVTSPPSIAVEESTSPAIASHQRRRRRSSSSSSSSEEEEQEQDEEQQVTSELLAHQSSSNPTASHPYHQQASTSPLLATSHRHRRVKRQRRHLDNITTSSSAPFSSTSSSEMHSGASMNGNGVASDGHSKLGTSSNGHHLTQEPSSSAVASSSRGKTIYPGSEIDREELVRLTLQCLQDAGYQ